MSWLYFFLLQCTVHTITSLMCDLQHLSLYIWIVILAFSIFPTLKKLNKCFIIFWNTFRNCLYRWKISAIGLTSKSSTWSITFALKKFDWATETWNTTITENNMKVQCSLIIFETVVFYIWKAIFYAKIG